MRRKENKHTGPTKKAKSTSCLRKFHRGENLSKMAGIKYQYVNLFSNILVQNIRLNFFSWELGIYSSSIVPWRLSSVASRLVILIFCDRIRSWRMARPRVKLKWEEKKKLKICLTSATQKWCIALISLFWQRWLFKKGKSWQKFSCNTRQHSYLFQIKLHFARVALATLVEWHKKAFANSKLTHNCSYGFCTQTQTWR